MFSVIITDSRLRESDKKRKRLHRVHIFLLLVFFFASKGKNATRKIFSVLPAKPSNEVYTSQISLLKNEFVKEIRSHNTQD